MFKNDNTELTESDAVPVSGDSSDTSADSVDELGGFPAQIPSAEPTEDSDISSAVELTKAEPAAGTLLENFCIAAFSFSIVLFNIEQPN
ncbi:hypothetical protein FBU30_006480 [Linnemannia zychae]|nr:hypothetical protein FBU30_006480 [Linnemannia zychae]